MGLPRAARGAKGKGVGEWRGDPKVLMGVEEIAEGRDPVRDFYPGPTVDTGAKWPHFKVIMQTFGHNWRGRRGNDTEETASIDSKTHHYNRIRAIEDAGGRSFKCLAMEDPRTFGYAHDGRHWMLQRLQLFGMGISTSCRAIREVLREVATW